MKNATLWGRFNMRPHNLLFPRQTPHRPVTTDKNTTFRLDCTPVFIANHAKSVVPAGRVRAIRGVVFACAGRVEFAILDGMHSALFHDNFFALFTTPWFWSAFLAWMIAQAAKLVSALILTHRFDFRYFVSTGGMPSAHSAMVTGLAASVGITEGFDSVAAMIAVSFASITMFDAAGVRRAAGQQAMVLNQMIDELFHKHRLSEDRLKELLGHTRLEVFCGLIIGALAAMGVCAQAQLHRFGA